MLALVLSPGAATNIQWAAALLVPLLVGLITKETASDGLKATLLTVLSALNAAIAALLQPGTVHVDVIARHFIQDAVIAVAAYYGFWAQTGISAKVAALTPRFGIGSPPTLETAEKEAIDTATPDSVAADVVELRAEVGEFHEAVARLSAELEGRPRPVAKPATATPSAKAKPATKKPAPPAKRSPRLP